MRFFLFSLVFFTAFFCGRLAFAQSDSVNTRLWHVKVSPQLFMVNALNLEIERRFSPGSRHSFTFSPRYYSGKTETIDKLAGRETSENANSTVSGFGYELMHRIYAKPGLKPAFTTYFAYGLNFQNFDLNYAKKGWDLVVEPSGLEYYMYGWHQKQEQIKRYGLAATFGLQQPFLFKRLVTDVFGGLGYHFAYFSNPQSMRYQSNILDYGHEGMYLTFGIKLGYSF